MRFIHLTTLPLIVGLLTLHAEADVIQISNTNGSFMLRSHDIAGLFNNASSHFTTSELSTVHSTLQNWGIDTDGKITIIPVNTNSGFSLITLVDEELGFGDTGGDGMLGLTSTAPNSLSMFINDSTQDTWSLIQPPFGSQTMGSTFVWGSIGSGDGFAWSNLAIGDALSYNFVDLDGDGGAINAEAFQFIGWKDGGWDIISSNGFKSDGSSVFTGTVVPAPPAALLLTVISLGYRRRRH